MQFYRWSSGTGNEGVNLVVGDDFSDIRTLYTSRDSRDADLFLAQCEIYCEHLKGLKGLSDLVPPFGTGVASSGGIHIAAEDIDLIVNLVEERLKPLLETPE